VGSRNRSRRPLAKTHGKRSSTPRGGHIRVIRFRFFFKMFFCDFRCVFAALLQIPLRRPSSRHVRVSQKALGRHLGSPWALLGSLCAPCGLQIRSRGRPEAPQRLPKKALKPSKQALTQLLASCRSPGPPGRLGTLSETFLGASLDPSDSNFLFLFRLFRLLLGRVFVLRCLCQKRRSATLGLGRPREKSIDR